MSEEQKEAVRLEAEMEIADDRDFLAGCRDARSGVEYGRSGALGGHSADRVGRYRAGWTNGRIIRGHGG